VGHEGAEGLTTGRSIPCGYWDLMPAGRYDLDACIYYYQALRAMARLERATKARGIAVPDVTVLGPDHSSRLSFRETPESLEALAEKVKARIEEVFWVPETQRFARCIDAKGEKKDYGFLHMNLMALHHGIGTEAQRDAILSWLDGRVISGDTSTGADIYRWRFAPRMTTQRNEEFYYWAWVWERNRDPENPQFVWGNQMQDGGGVPFTSFFELAVRTSTGRQGQIDRAFGRTLEIGDWFRDVKAAGGEGRDFYRTYYNSPERGMLQGGGPAGGLGMDREFLSDAALGTVFVPEAFLRVDAPEDGVLALAPTLPSGLDKIGMRNLFYRGNHLTVEASWGYVSLEGSRIPNVSGLRLRVTLRNVPERFVCLVDGKPVEEAKRNARGEVTVETDLAPVRIEVRAQP
jgi:Glycosyl hydrolase family 65, C-terminal domain